MFESAIFWSVMMLSNPIMCCPPDNMKSPMIYVEENQNGN